MDKEHPELDETRTAKQNVQLVKNQIRSTLMRKYKLALPISGGALAWGSLKESV